MANLMNDLNHFSNQTVDLSFQEATFTKEQFPLDQLIATNKSVLDAIASFDDQRSKKLMHGYLTNTPISQIIDVTLLSHLQDNHAPTTIAEKFFANDTANKLIKNAIEKETWAKIERLSGPLITYFNQVLDAEVLDATEKREFMNLAESFLLKIRNSRSLYGVDLARFFKLIRQLQEENQLLESEVSMYDKLIMNVSCNLRTLGVNLVFQVEEDSSDISIGNDSLF